MLDPFIQAYKVANPEIQAFVDSDQIPLLAQDLCEREVVKKTYRETVIALSDYVLSLIDENGLQTKLDLNNLQLDELLEELGRARRQTLKVQGLPDADSDVPEKLELRPEGVPRQAPQEPEPATKPLTREDVLSALSPKRTMASDIASVQQSEEVKDE